MAKEFTVEVLESCLRSWRVIAETKEEAEEKWRRGDAEPGEGRGRIVWLTGKVERVLPSSEVKPLPRILC